MMQASTGYSWMHAPQVTEGTIAPGGRPMARLIAVLLWAAFTLGGAMSGPAQAESVVVLLSANAEEYQKAVKGFVQATDCRILATYDMRGDLGRGREHLQQIETKDKPDLIFAVGIFALQAVAKEQPKTPVVFSMVLNPPSVLKGNASITGASMNVPVEQTFAMFKQLNPSTKRIGTVYNEQNTGFLIEEAKAAAKKLDLELIVKSVESEREAIRAIDELAKEKVEVYWGVPDRLTLGPAFLEQLLLYSFRNRVPLMGVSKRHADMGALLSLASDSSEDIGRQAGELAKAMWAGKSATELPFTSARKLEMIVNLRTARKLGIEIPEDLLKQAGSVIR